jgi:hypothetical protein
MKLGEAGIQRNTLWVEGGYFPIAFGGQKAGRVEER